MTRQGIAPVSPAPAGLLETSLSRSDLWRLQRDYFARQGVEAWRRNVVPSYVTTNPFVAETYADLVLAYIKDLPPGEPVHVLELGAGSGRFAHSFLRRFFSRHDGARRVVYVMTDISEANARFWREHERLKPYVERGQLDFALFDAGHDRELSLLSSGRRLSAGGGPLAAIANYVFDSIEQDLFEVKDGRLFECRVRLSGDESPNDVEVDYHLHPCPDDYYGDPAWDALLAEHRRGLKDTAFLLPVGALRCLEYLKALSGGRMLLLAGDKGQATLEALQGRAKPNPTRHGSFSLGVNFYALAAHARRMGGDVLRTSHPAASLNVAAYVFDGSGRDHPETRRTFDEKVVRFGPDDFFMMKKAAEKNGYDLTLPQMIALLRLSRWDQAILSGSYKRLTALLPDAPSLQRAEFHACIGRIWEGYYPLLEEEDLAFRLGNLMAALGDYKEALRYFGFSLGAYGENEGVRTNIVLCEKFLEERP